MASQLLQSERSEVVYDWRANELIADKRNFRHWKIADNVTCNDRRNAVFHSRPWEDGDTHLRID